MTNDRPLRFCMITTFYPPYNFGGDGIFVHQLSNELARRGHQVDVIHCIDAYRLMGRCAPAETYRDHPNVTVHGLKTRFGSVSPLATQQTGLPLFKSTRIRQILGKGFDVIHYHNVSLIGGPKILEYGNAIKLYTMHEYWLVCPTHVLFRFNRAVCTRPHCFTCGLTYKRPPQLWRHSGMMQSAVKHVDAFIAPSRFSKDLHNRLGLKAPIVHVPHFVPGAGNGTPLPLRRNQPEQKPYFLFVGRLEKIKGLQTIIPIFRDYEKAQLWIAGEGTYGAHLRLLAEGSDNVRFLGHRTKDELQALYRDATALIAPSLSLEVFALVILEAFVQGTPAIVRNIGGMPEIIQESGGGFIYNSEEDLLAAMERLLTDSSCRDQLGACGYKALEEKWTADAHLRSYLGLIGQIAVARDDHGRS
ncbi:MAG: glycosyltransferase family 4 protein [Candidatus Binatia bacterium]